MYGYHREKLHVNHFWELMSEVVVIKVSCFQRAFKAGRCALIYLVQVVV